MTWNGYVVERSYACVGMLFVMRVVKSEGHVGMGVKNDWNALDRNVKGVLGRNCCAGSYPNDVEGSSRGLILLQSYRVPTMDEQ